MPFRSCRFVRLLVVLIIMQTAVAGVRLQADERALVGRLATVEPASRRLTLVPEGEEARVEVYVPADGEVREEDRRLTLSELVLLVGRRVTIRYLLQDGRRLARSVIVEAS